MQPFTWETLAVTAIGIITYLIVASYTPLFEQAIFNMAVKSVLVTVIFFSGIFYFKLSTELLDLLQKGFQMAKNFRN